MKILLVEDEEKVLSFLKSALELEGNVVHPCSSYESFSDFLETKTITPDVVILDRMLNGRDGTKLIRATKEAFPGVGVLILSAINTFEEKAAVLDLGADDYLSKPFSIIELAARIRAISRRSIAHEADATLKLRDIKLDLIQRTAQVADLKVDLSNKEFQLLTTLLKTPGRVFNKYQLLNKIWDVQSDIESNVVEATIKNLRNKLSKAGSSVEIQSRRNVGYWIEN